MLTFICPGLWVEVWKLDLQRFQGGKYFFVVSFYHFHHFLSQKLLFEIENLWNEQTSVVFASVGLEADEPIQDLQTKSYISYISLDFISYYFFPSAGLETGAGLCRTCWVQTKRRMGSPRYLSTAAPWTSRQSHWIYQIFHMIYEYIRCAIAEKRGSVRRGTLRGRHLHDQDAQAQSLLVWTSTKV